ncbi:hypothetical protein BDV95DRAFT_85590 [Massariosphaeria phaeospora]|uniref:Ammonium transporter AmtB-like domain-containing protein n=1 Tax=Massariosphaeria phaeospora TaxID=100035 RepID=A0A7C8IB63_9PLEO|nr:hypothetical protein BDV95DRAFT_85590 [Massariosphaeria phaeospora]
MHFLHWHRLSWTIYCIRHGLASPCFSLSISLSISHFSIKPTALHQRSHTLAIAFQERHTQAEGGRALDTAVTNLVLFTGGWTLTGVFSAVPLSDFSSPLNSLGLRAGGWEGRSGVERSGEEAFRVSMSCTKRVGLVAFELGLFWMMCMWAGLGGADGWLAGSKKNTLPIPLQSRATQFSSVQRRSAPCSTAGLGPLL